MERLENLIAKLTQQFNTAASMQAMHLTVQLIESELLFLQKGGGENGKHPVHVTMPIHFKANKPAEDVDSIPVSKSEKLMFELDPSVPNKLETGPILMPFNIAATMPQTMAANGTNGFINDDQPKAPSVNETLEHSIIELGTILHQTPIKDLKKAISINDQYQYIKQLFMGDESAYERSIKTINSFNTLAEAVYWIRRELAVKYAWREDDFLVQQFQLLVNRRFSLM